KEELAQILQHWGEPSYRAGQLWQGLYRSLWSRADQFTVFPKSLRQKLNEHFVFESLSVVNESFADQGMTHKVLFHTPEGNPVETVLMRSDDGRITLCISSQSGCGMGCVFCATGHMGFLANLTAGQIVEQVLYFARLLKQENKTLSNIVVMGMGEPFHNFAQTLQAIDRLNDPSGFRFGERRFTISTVGIAPMIRKFTALKRQINLAISLHAADDELRSQLVPINRKYPLEVLLEACREYVEQTHRRISFEWVLIHQVNDSREQAYRLARLLKGLLCHVNLIPLNPTPGYRRRAPPQETIEEFKAVLQSHRIPCTVRAPRGLSIWAGCGQLAALQQERGLGVTLECL
ncbi:MAG: 23S rRNA (adenine(2503)-C(2))-methyltransferase RlmN, partial [Anaerolineales bacterium]|nr:23S rRNA (adenine(2503)-C(2))-methyltransferase RlmN [Anaerolineales bacterium]MDW8446584.1 23S rRNA (adenine(2503)-C(2))-methyltransferase RlmN [Anaerolineales bacterium]